MSTLLTRGTASALSFGFSNLPAPIVPSLPNGTEITVQYVVVAGGGGGGNGDSSHGGGGGGAGGYLAGTASMVTGTAYNITIGAGGTIFTQGSNSTFSNIVTYGGGGGAPNGPAALNGGSGGGGGTLTWGGHGEAGKGVYPGSTYIDAPRQGYDGYGGGGNMFGPGGGGGGAGGIGSVGVGGIGISSNITGTAVTYASGGGGGISFPSGYGNAKSTPAEPPNTGNGAKGGDLSNVSVPGSSGIVIFRVPITLIVQFSPTLAYTFNPVNNGTEKVYRAISGSGTVTFL